MCVCVCARECMCNYAHRYIYVGFIKNPAIKLQELVGLFVGFTVKR